MITNIPMDSKIMDRFFSYVAPPDENGCRMFRGTPSNPYGTFSITPKLQMSAHRVAYYIYHGNLPEDREIAHACNIKGCVTEEHLVAQTRQENDADSRTDGLFIPAYGVYHCGAKLDDDKVRYIRTARKGKGVSLIAREVGVSRQSVQDVIAGRTWKHVI